VTTPPTGAKDSTSGPLDGPADRIQGGDAAKPATAARIYDYILGGTHNFPADRAAADMLVQGTPVLPAIARSNRAFLRRAVRFLADAGIRQFLDIGSGIPTAGNVHEVAELVPDARVMYVDIDPVAVAESLDLLEGNDRATAIRADLRDAQAILDHPELKRLIDFDQPVALLLVSMLHFVDDDAYAAVGRLIAALGPGSYLAISHGTIPDETLAGDIDGARAVYRANTATPLITRSRDEIARFFTGLDLVEPGLVWVPLWRPAPDDPTDFADKAMVSGVLAGVGVKA
jgi:SAM-dependent methyltransferase